MRLPPAFSYNALSYLNDNRTLNIFHRLNTYGFLLSGKFWEDDFARMCFSQSGDEGKGSSLSNVYCQKEVKIASRNVTWPTVKWLTEAPPINSQKGDNYFLFLNTAKIKRDLISFEYKLSNEEIKKVNEERDLEVFFNNIFKLSIISFCFAGR